MEDYGNEMLQESLMVDEFIREMEELSEDEPQEIGTEESTLFDNF